ncbi:DUF1177 family protein [Caballeronia ptereochthonis]|uniref:Outer membrane protein (Porin)-like protein n=1 Tax=Caballeronia ptereochthonis TaxID=1777144 RepID=A0A158EB10_9BURK|nr:DUF1177 family protein [Caballeronia ptereochthonis]SAL04069.1 outer membrane protein (porin)-like protein [Caballeronia ptereochthonis]
MKGKYIALAMTASAMAGAHAQSNVTLYGVVDAALSYQTHSNPAGEWMRSLDRRVEGEQHLVKVMQSTTGRAAFTLPITQQDITPYDNGPYHFNSIMQPHAATGAPVVGVALTAESVVGGSDSSASHEVDIAEAVRFCLEVAKRYTAASADNPCEFYDAAEWRRIRQMYPDLSVPQTYGSASERKSPAADERSALV